MTFKQYLQDKMQFLIFLALFIGVITLIALVYKASNLLLIAIWVLTFAPLGVWFGIDFIRKKSFYNQIGTTLSLLEDKYVLHATLPKSTFVEAELLAEIVTVMGKAMNDRLQLVESKNQSYREYIESWVHEVKIPVSAMGLILENNADQSLCFEELDKIDRYIEQVLYYARSESVERDFFVKRFAVQDALKNILNRHAKSFIYKKISLKTDGLEATIIADQKWVEYILDQLVGNAIKYMDKPNPKITIETHKGKNATLLRVMDNGMGIPQQDLSRIFTKGFIGENGRLQGKSTGMGLYICKQLCDKMQIGISVTSSPNEGTTFTLTFPESEYTQIE
ncbi:MAG: sensor histidine kinase [Erysipelotrichaceae bacterium]